MTKFVIVAAPRSGTTHLMHILNRRRDIMCHGEAFAVKVGVRLPPPKGDAVRLAGLKELREREPLAYLLKVYELDGGKPIVGFKMFHDHNPTVMAHLLDDHSVRKVLLVRANALARYASTLAMKEMHRHRELTEKPTVHFDERKFLKQHNAYVRFVNEAVRTLIASEQTFHYLRYDELNNAASMMHLFQFLGADAKTRLKMPKVDVARGSSDILSRFSNRDEVDKFVTANALQCFRFESDAMLEPVRP